MPKLIFLGTSNAIPDEKHENTHMVLVGDTRTVLIDCSANQILRFHKAGVNFHDLSDLVLTHFHPDHVTGVPQLLMNMWLLGHDKPLNIYGLHYTLDRIEDLMGFYGWADWPHFFPVAFHRLPIQEMVTLLDCEEMSIFSSPVQHMIPAIGLRVVIKEKMMVFAYSCDTEPCEQVVRLAQGAKILVHEAAGALVGHSSAAQAGDIARQAGAESLYLIHYPTGPFAKAGLEEEARKTFSGNVIQAEDFMVLEL